MAMCEYSGNDACYVCVLSVFEYVCTTLILVCDVLVAMVVR